MSGVFVNYRSNDEVFAVEMLAERLTQVFGSEHVFVDHHSLPPGADFRPLLWARLATSSVLLVLIGKRWLGLADPNGQSLLHREEDYVRCEIRKALEANKVTIPVLLDGARKPTEAELPADIVDLASRQYMTIDRKDVKHGIERVVDAVRMHVPAIDRGRQEPPPQTGSGNRSIYNNSGQATQGKNSHAVGTVIGGNIVGQVRGDD